MKMSFITKLRAMQIFLRISPYIDRPVWTKNDAEAFLSYLKSESGVKMKSYLLNYVLTQTAQAISNTTNLQFGVGACNGSKAILSIIESLAEPENYTDGDAEGS